MIQGDMLHYTKEKIILANKSEKVSIPSYIIGIDEAGRGPLAGPVVVGGIRIESGIMNHEVWNGIKDSKKLSAKQREKWFEILTNHPKIKWAVARVGHTIIDRINIREASNLGARRVHGKLSTNSKSKPNKRIRSFARDSLFVDEIALLDGGLVLPKKIPHRAIIKGDEKIPIIAAASIIAKVTRDRLMFRLHKKYPQYRFDLHKGYGTRLHREMIREWGRCEAHRESFRC